MYAILRHVVFTVRYKLHLYTPCVPHHKTLQVTSWGAGNDSLQFDIPVLGGKIIGTFRTKNFSYKAGNTVQCDAPVRSRASQCEISGRRSGIGTHFSPSTSVLPNRHHSINPSCQYYSYQKGKLAKRGTFKLGYVLSNIKNWTDEGFHIQSSEG